MTQEIFLIIISLILIYDALLDLAYYRLPNKIFYALFLLYPIYVLSMENADLLRFSWNFLAFLAFGMVLYGFKIIGGGDAKLIAVLSLWVGCHWIQLLFWIALIGGVLAVSYLVVPSLLYQITTGTQTLFKKVNILNTLNNSLLTENIDILEEDAKERFEKRYIPYGVCIVMGGLITLWLHFSSLNFFRSWINWG